MSTQSNNKHYKLECQKIEDELRKYKRMYETAKDSLFSAAAGEMRPPSSKDYDMFVHSENNRAIHWDKGLERSMRTYGFWDFQPISVTKRDDGKYTIIAGHNRFEMAKKLNIPFYFTVTETEIPIEDREGLGKGHDKWSPGDWVTMHAQNGKHDYIVIKETSQRYNLSITTSIFLLCGGAQSIKCIKDGELKIKTGKIAWEILADVKHMEEYGVTFARDSMFIRAYYYVKNIEGINTDMLLARLKSNPKILTKRTTILEFLEELDTAYNFRTSEPLKMPIKHMAEKIMREKTHFRYKKA